MKREHLEVKGRDTEFVEFNHQQYNILFTRFDHVSLTDTDRRKETRYLYLIYIFRKHHHLAREQNSNMEMDTFNIICFNKGYFTFEEMVLNLYSILAEYILNQDEVFRCLKKVQKLNPQN